MDTQTAHITIARLTAKYTNEAALHTAIGEYQAYLQREYLNPHVAEILRTCLEEMEPDAAAWEEARSALAGGDE